MCNTSPIKEWYFFNIPTQSSQYIKFLSNAHRLGHPQVKNYESCANTHPLPKGTTAHIPDWVLDSQVIPPNTSLDDKHALHTAFWNHAVLMNKMLFGRLEKYTKKPYSQSLTDDLNIMEFVLSLHANNKLQTSNFGRFTEATNAFMYTKNTLMQAVNEFLASSQGPNQLGDVLTHYFNPVLRDDVRNIVGHEITDILDKIINYTGKTDKGLARLSNMLYELLFKNENQESPQQGNEATPPDEQGNTSPESSNGQEKNEETKAQAAQNWQEDNANTEADINELQFSKTSDEMKQATKEINQAMVSGGWDQSDNTEELTVMDIMDTDVLKTIPIIASSVFENLGSVVRQIKTKQSEPIEPHLYGHDLLEDQLFRAVTDRKVMGTLEDIQKPPQKEWKILVDLSGSTSRWVETQNGGGSIWQIELETGKGAFLALRDAREEVAFYGHTTYTGPIVYKIASSKDTNINRRFNLASGVYKGSNYDDIVIEWIARHEFKHKDSLKFILVLSDGKPCGYGGIRKLKEVVDQLRKRDFVIISFSLVQEVIHNNDAIYGKKWNIDASSGDVDQKMRELLLKITAEHK
jgi:hypothetical protein